VKIIEYLFAANLDNPGLMETFQSVLEMPLTNVALENKLVSYKPLLLHAQASSSHRYKKTADLIFLGGYISFMAWEVEYTDEFEASFMPLIPAERQFYLLVAKRQVVRGGMKNTHLLLKEFMRSI
jgi:hypothetical protein